MTEFSLTRIETSFLMAAAREGGRLILPEGMKPASRQRLIGRLLRDTLIAAGDEAGGHRLTSAGYTAIGLKAPRAKRVTASVASPTMALAAASTPKADPAASVGTSAATTTITKKALLEELLTRGEGASIAELMGATGWLPHTVRAALSRLRSAGQPLLKSQREDAVTAYRIVREETVPGTKSRRSPWSTSLASGSASLSAPAAAVA